MAVESTYCTLAEVDTYALDNGYPEWLDLEKPDKLKYVLNATFDIIRKHQQLPSDGSLWLSTDARLNKACILQSLYLYRNYDYRLISERIKNITDSNYSDDVLTIGNSSNTKYDEQAEFIIDRVVQEADELGSLIDRPNIREFYRA